MKKKTLTSKEERIVICLISGMSAKIISKNLNVSIRTVEYYQKRIKTKLNCNNTYQTGFEIGAILNLKEQLEPTKT